MEIFHKLGKKTLITIGMLLLVILFDFLNLVTKTFNFSTFFIIFAVAVTFIVLNLRQRQEDMLQDAARYIEKAEEAMRKRQGKGAIHFFDEALKMEPKNVRAQMGKGQCYRALTEYGRAVEEFRKALDIDPNLPEAYLHMGICHLEEGNRKVAEQDFEMALKINPNYNEVLPYLGDLKQFKGQGKEASKLYVKYLENCPESRKAAILERLEKADPDKAREIRTGKIEEEHSLKAPPIPPQEDAPPSQAPTLPVVHEDHHEDAFHTPTYMKRESQEEGGEEAAPAPAALKAALPEEAMESAAPQPPPVPQAPVEEAPPPPALKAALPEEAMESAAPQPPPVPQAPVEETPPPPAPGADAKPSPAVEEEEDEDAFRLPTYMRRAQAEQPAPPPAPRPRAAAPPANAGEEEGEMTFREPKPMAAEEIKAAPAKLPPVMKAAPIDQVMGTGSAAPKAAPAPKAPAKAAPAKLPPVMKATPIDQVMGTGSAAPKAAPAPKAPARASTPPPPSDGLDDEEGPRLPTPQVDRKRRIPQAELPPDLEASLNEIRGFAKFAGTVDVDPMLRWSAFSYLSRFAGNVKRIFAESPDFAMAVTAHKLESLRKFEQTWKESPDVSRYFQDVVAGSNNVGVIDTAKVFRCSQPSLADLAWFAGQMDVKGVINLCNEEQIWTGYAMKDEEEACGELLIDYIHIPLENWDDPPPSHKEILEVLDEIKYHAKPVLVHSSNGSDRLGLVGSAYRMSALGWPLEEAVEEAEHYGYDLEGHPGQFEVIKSFQAKGKA
jgi:tetratricopeptide (TPR) repeat protein